MRKLLTRGALGVLWVLWLAPVYLLLVIASRTTDEYLQASTWSLPHHVAE